MKENGNGTFYAGSEAGLIYPDVVPVYRAAFAGEPWFEVSRCEDPSQIQKCVGGFSTQEIGTFCGNCNLTLKSPAYEADELIAGFERIAEAVPTAWYTEGNEEGLNLAAFVWKANSDFIADEKYSDVPEMKNWLRSVLGEQPVLWLDEIFADRAKKPSRNLENFKQMAAGFKEELGPSVLAFRTINERLIRGALRDFKSGTVYRAFNDAPDRRSVVVLEIPLEAES